MGKARFYSELILSNKSFQGQIGFPKNAVSGGVEQLLTVWHFTVLSNAAAQTVPPKLRDHFN